MNFLRRLLIFLAGNVLAQGLAAVTGLALARWLSVEQYAVYTVATVTMGAVAVLSKGGANVGFTAILGRTWPDFERIAKTLPALGQARRVLARYLMPLVLALAGLVLYRAGAEPVIIVLILILLAAFWIADMHSQIIDQVLFFARQTTRVQLMDSGLAVLRFLAAVALYLTGLLNAVTAVMIGVLVAFARIRPIRHWVFRIIPKYEGKPLPEDVSEIKAGVRRQLPTEAFYVSQMQIVMFVLAFRSDPAVIAGFGALMRLAALLAPIRVLNNAFFIPFVARAKEHVALKIIGISALMSLPGFTMTAIAFLFPNLLLWLLGPNYSHLHQELLVMTLCLTFTQASGEFWNLVAHRGWVKYSSLQVLIGFAWVGIAFTLLDLSTISGALILNAGFAIGNVLIGALELYLNRPRGETHA